jgi:hypothetical protein
MYNYCTLFDSNYLTRGLAMYESLKKQSDKFHLYIFAFDDRSNELLRKLNLEFVTVVSLKEFEDEELLALKDSRSAGEYCWTCTPSIIKYSIEKYNLESCTYLDADLYFFSNPAILIEEMGEESVLITEHRYTPEYDYSATSGIYCVQFMTFKNDKNGMKVLNWWRDACNKWCYARFEDGKFGDQKYLDDWTTRFEGVHELQHLGGGVAPWNIQQYDIDNLEFELVFYHFHNFKFLPDDKVDLGIYRFGKNDIKIFYKPYIKHLQKIAQELKKFDSENGYHGIVGKKPFHWKNPFRLAKRKIKGVYNIFDLHNMIGDK